MKTVSKYILGALALSLVSCESTFFSSESPSSFTPEEVYTSPALTEQSILSIYEVFGEDRGYRNRLTCGYAGMNTDVEYNRKSNNSYATYEITPTNTDLSSAKGADPWGHLNTIIERANNVVDGISKYSYATCKTERDSARYDYMKGEALFLRAFAMLEMVKYWGDVPVNVTAYDGIDIEHVTSAKQDRNVSYEQIRKDLKEAARLMEWSVAAQQDYARNDVRRPSRGAAYALLARADLMYAGKAIRPTRLEAGCKDYVNTWNLEKAEDRMELYKEALHACNEIIKNEDGKLLDDYGQVFKNICADVTNYAQMEHLWVVPMANGARGQVLNYNCAKFNSTGDGDFTMGILLHNKQYDASDVKSNSAVAIVPTLLFEYENSDVRRNITICPYKWNTTTCGNIDETLPRAEKSKYCLYPMLQADPTQWICGKYRIEWMSRDNDNQDDGIDWPVIRYADVLLMFAEASIGSVDNLGAGAVTIDSALACSGLEALNKVRARAKVAPLATLNLEAIQNERKLEFAGELIRKWDLMRWGILKEKMIETHEAIEELRANYDGHNICATYKEDNSVLQAGAVKNDGKTPVVRAYVIDQVYGYRLDENDSKSAPWLKKSVKFAEKLVDTNYILYNYDNPDCLESHQYWPIFSTIIGTSNGLLFNNYGY